jgi:hypothetical protein
MSELDAIVRRAAMTLVRSRIEQLPRGSRRAIEDALSACAEQAPGLRHAINCGEAEPVYEAVRAETKKIVEWLDGQLGFYWLAAEEPS